MGLRTKLMVAICFTACAVNVSMAAYKAVVDVSKLPQQTFNGVSGDDSAALMSAINRASGKRTTVNGKILKGGVINISSGSYVLCGVKLKSNVYIRFKSGVTISSPTLKQGTFILDNGISNVSIIGPATFNVNSGQQEHRAFKCANVSNFEIKNFTIKEKHSKFCSIILTGTSRTTPTPSNGTIAGIKVTGASGGYGAVQCHGCRNMLFKSITSTGGVALRLESGIETSSGIQNVKGIGIKCTNGRAAVMMQPHGMDHKKVTLQNITSVGSTFAVEMKSGFVDSDASDPNKIGTFAQVTMSNVKATYGTHAQLRPFSFSYVPKQLVNKIQNLRSDDTIYGPAIGAIGNFATNYSVTVPNSAVTAYTGFTHQPKKVMKPSNTTLTQAQVRALLKKFNNAPQE